MRRRIFHFPFYIFNSCGADGTNPNDAANFRFRGTLNATDSDVSASVTNFLSWGVSEDTSAGSDQFAGASRSIPVDVIVTDGRFHVACWRDLDKDGVYTEGIDAQKAWTFGSSFNGKTLSVSLGDMDADGLSDSVEHAEGTDPNARTNYCYNILVTYTGIFQTTNALTFAALWGTNTVWGAMPVTTKTWTHDFGHRVATHGERASVRVWDDANHNGVWDDGETGDKYEFSPSSHTMNVSKELLYGHFDRDDDNLPDWWEVQNGLSISDASDAWSDPDGDGLTNMQEFIYGGEAQVSIGTNNLFWVIAHSVDDRLNGKTPTDSLSKFLNYHDNGQSGTFITNGLFWANDVDTSCASMWQNSSRSIMYDPCHGWHMAGTAISRRHIVCANHFGIPDGTILSFMGTNGCVYTRQIFRSRVVGSDIRVSVLDQELPEEVTPAYLLPTSYTNYIGNAEYVPVVTFDQNERLIVAELTGLKPYSKRTNLSTARCPENGLRSEFYAEVVSGDSGNPRFMLVGNKVVLLYLMWKGGGGQGCFMSNYITEIQSAMDILCQGYQLQTIDLSGFDQLNH